MKDLSEASYILGIKIYHDRSRRMIDLSQSTYIDRVLNWFKMQYSKRGYLPMSHGIYLKKEDYLSSTTEKELMSRMPYASAIGSIMFAMICATPDESYTLKYDGQIPSKPLVKVTRYPSKIS